MGESKLPMLLNTIKESIDNINTAIKEHRDFCTQKAKEQHDLDLFFMYDLHIFQNKDSIFDYIFSYTNMEEKFRHKDRFCMYGNPLSSSINPLTMETKEGDHE